jgi:hypothetical protein
MDDRIKFNVGGRKFETTRGTILKYPDSVLAKHIGDLSKSDKKGRYFIDRNPEVFAAILEYYRSNVLACPPQVSVDIFIRELDFWGFKDGVSVTYSSSPNHESDPLSQSILNVDRITEESILRNLPDDHVIQWIYQIYVNRECDENHVLLTLSRDHRKDRHILTFSMGKRLSDMTITEQINTYITVMRTYFNFTRVTHETPVVNEQGNFMVNGVSYGPTHESTIFDQHGQKIVHAVVGYL